MYALTGASGQLGQLVVKHLLTHIPANQIIATTRTPERLADFSAKGVVVRQADLDDPVSLSSAFAGATRLLIISTDTIGKRFHQHHAAIKAAVSAGVNHIHYTSAPAADPNSPNPIVAEHGQTEAVLAATGVKWTALRNNLYSDFLPGMLGPLLDDGKLFSLAGDSKPIWISREDCARTAADLLAGDGTITGPVDVTGPEALGLTELAERLSSLTGQTVVRQVLTEEELKNYLRAKGLPEQAVGFLLGVLSWITGGDFATVTDLVERATRSRPVSIDETLRSLVLTRVAP